MMLLKDLPGASVGKFATDSFGYVEALTARAPTFQKQ
jgi:hypothetical protein